MLDLLGDVSGGGRPSSIFSSAELIAREGVDLRKSMNYRDGPDISVFLVLPHDGVFRDEWHPQASTYVFLGHDSVTADAGKKQDQRTMYESGRLSDNGTFLKAVNAFANGMRSEPLQVQVYEKLDPGVWFDKGIFNLVDVQEGSDGTRRTYRFLLQPANKETLTADPATSERMLPAAIKASVWTAAGGRCGECGTETGLRFAAAQGSARLLCPVHRGEGGGLLG